MAYEPDIDIQDPNQQGGPKPFPTNSPKCDCARIAYEKGHSCYSVCGPKETPPPSTSNACPPGQCKDVVTGQCRSFNANREKMNESDDPTRRGLCKQKEGLDTGGGGGAAAGPKAATAGGGGGFGFTDMFGLGEPQSQFIWSNLQDIISGKTSRYNPSVVAALEGKAKTTQQAAIEQGTRGVRREAARAGVARSPFLNRAFQDVTASANTNFSQAIQQIGVDKATADFEDRVTALNSAQNWLNSMRDYVVKLDVNQVER